MLSISAFLITTADERTWKKEEEIIFLGEWCKLYSRKRIWSKLDFKTLPYHWDNRSKYYKDYKYLSDIYERYLKTLSKSLNKIHGYNYSIRYWRIVIGPWLRFFIDTVFDRYCSIKSAIKNEKITSTWIMDSDIVEWIPKDYNQFYQSFTNDQWNHLIYGEIIKIIEGFSYEIIEEKNQPDRHFNKISDYSQLSRLKNLILNAYARIIPNKYNSILFTSSYFDLNNLIKLQLEMGQFPYLQGPVVETKNIAVNKKLRDLFIINLQENEFGRILDLIIPLQMPKCYLEGFGQLKILANKYFPKKIKSIYTANSYSHDDVFKIWAAGQIEKGNKLYIGQHGGNLGVCLWSQREDHQITVSDKYFSWGWNDKQNDHIKPMPAAKLLNLKNKIVPKNSGDILSILASFPRYFFCSFSMPIAGQFLDYINFQVQLTKRLEPGLLKLYRVRLDSTDYGWDTLERFSDDDLIDNIETSNIKLFDRLKECRLCVVPHNATVFLETFTSNFPTILFWNPKYYEIRESAKPYYDELNRVGILHYTPESASLMLNRIYHNPMEWWMQKEIQIAKDRFCEKYAYVSDNWLGEWKTELLNIDSEQNGDEKYLN